MRNQERNVYDIIIESEQGEADEARRAAAIVKTRSLLGAWRRHFEGQEASKEYSSEDGSTTKVYSQSPTHVRIEYKSADSTVVYNLEEDGDIQGTVENGTTDEHAPVASDFFGKHDTVARVLFDCDRSEFRS